MAAFHRMIVTTFNEVSGCKITIYQGVVRGIVVRTASIGQNLLGGLRSIGGGNIPEYVDVCEAARQEAYDLMIEHAEALEANAVIGFRYDATEFMPGATEVLAYGTAVRIEPG